MDYQLGASKAEYIPREAFSLHNYIETSDKQKLRIYLLTKTKVCSYKISNIISAYLTYMYIKQFQEYFQNDRQHYFSYSYTRAPIQLLHGKIFIGGTSYYELGGFDSCKKRSVF